MRKLVLTIAALGVAATAAFAASAAIGERKALFREMGQATRPIGAMLQGAAPFDLAAVQRALDIYAANAPKLKGLFPDDSKEGDTKALPAIWENKADFESRFDAFAAQATAAKAAITDEATFRQNMGPLLGNCGACHDRYQAKS
jgi:cytochrome c556